MAARRGKEQEPEDAEEREGQGRDGRGRGGSQVEEAWRAAWSGIGEHSTSGVNVLIKLAE